MPQASNLPIEKSTETTVVKSMLCFKVNGVKFLHKTKHRKLRLSPNTALMQEGRWNNYQVSN